MSPSPLDSFPWASLGRRETQEEFWRKHAEQVSRVPLLPRHPLVSLIVPVDADTREADLALTVESVARQSYPEWEITLVGHPDAKKASIGRDSLGGKLRTVEATGNGVALRNRGAAQARGEWLGFLAAGDVLSPVALFQMILELEFDGREFALLYPNEVRFEEGFHGPETYYSKPQPSWFTLAHFNYVGPFWLVKASWFEAVGGLVETDCDGAEQGFLLRLQEKKAALAATPYFFLYRAKSLAKDSALMGSAEVVRAHLRRIGFPAEVRDDGNLRIVPRFKDLEAHRISAIICFRNRAEWTIQAIQSLCQQVGRIPLEVFLVDNNSDHDQRAKVEKVVEGLAVPNHIISFHFISFPGPFNFARMHNTVVEKHAKGDLLLMLNNDVFLSDTGNLDEWAAWAIQDGVGSVGALLRYPRGGVQHGGIKAWFGGEARLVRTGHEQGSYFFTARNREVFANTFAACMLKRSTFEALGGLRPFDLANGFGDVAFNFECLRRGWHHLFLGGIEGVHLESASRGLGYEYWEETEIERRYPDILQKMLRFDLGCDRVPRPDYSLPDFLKQLARIKLREKWFDSLRPSVKRLLRTVSLLGSTSQ
jgi:GT2 family glycosyltransferase